MTTTLFYREAWNESLVFAPPEEALRIHQIRQALETAKTWGEFRDLMPERDYEELRERMSGNLDEEESFPSDDTAFEAEQVLGFSDGDYPDWLQAEADRFVPEDVLDRFGAMETTVFNGHFWRIAPTYESAIVEMLATHRITAIKREDLRFF